MDCIVLVGNREHYRNVHHADNKAFLVIHGRTILQMMLDELQQVDAVSRLILVGPAEKLKEHLDEVYGPDGYPKQVLIVKQAGDLVSNVLAGLEASAEDAPADRHVLILPSDLPLMIAEEVRQFIDLCDMDRYDYVLGMTHDNALEIFYPTEDLPGVKMAYFHLAGGLYRINNMHMARPSAVKRLDFFRKTYAMRYQKKLVNNIKMTWTFFKQVLRAPQGIFFYLGMFICMHLSKWGFKRISNWIQSFLPISSGCRNISRILGCRFGVVVTDLGGAAIDVDNDPDFAAISVRHEEWLAAQRKRLERMKQ
ncbi:MAG: NTP transferase domain-containing protein [Acidobacteriota bacterium]|nr:NTP transferase domain-containing protein [Acidobacteriota bacterium]